MIRLPKDPSEFQRQERIDAGFVTHPISLDVYCTLFTLFTLYTVDVYGCLEVYCTLFTLYTVEALLLSWVTAWLISTSQHLLFPKNVSSSSLSRSLCKNQLPQSWNSQIATDFGYGFGSKSIIVFAVFFHFRQLPYKI